MSLNDKLISELKERLVQRNTKTTIISESQTELVKTLPQKPLPPIPAPRSETVEALEPPTIVISEAAEVDAATAATETVAKSTIVESMSKFIDENPFDIEWPESDSPFADEYNKIAEKNIVTEVDESNVINVINDLPIPITYVDDSDSDSSSDSSDSSDSSSDSSDSSDSSSDFSSDSDSGNSDSTFFKFMPKIPVPMTIPEPIMQTAATVTPPGPTNSPITPVFEFKFPELPLFNSIPEVNANGFRFPRPAPAHRRRSDNFRSLASARSARRITPITQPQARRYNTRFQKRASDGYKSD